MCSRLCLRAELVPKHFFIRGLSVVDILEFCLLVLGNLTGRGSLPHGRKLLLPLLQDGGDSTRNEGRCAFLLSGAHHFTPNCLLLKGGQTSGFARHCLASRKVALSSSGEVGVTSIEVPLSEDSSSEVALELGVL